MDTDAYQSDLKANRKNGVETVGKGNGNPLQYSCLENPMDKGAWWAAVHGVTKESDTTSACIAHYMQDLCRHREENKDNYTNKLFGKDEIERAVSVTQARMYQLQRKPYRTQGREKPTCNCSKRKLRRHLAENYKWGKGWSQAWTHQEGRIRANIGGKGANLCGGSKMWDEDAFSSGNQGALNFVFHDRLLISTRSPEDM